MTSTVRLCYRATSSKAYEDLAVALSERTVQNECMSTSAMAREAKEASQRVAAQLDQDSGRVSEIATRLRDFSPRAILTCARGSSDHAATYARYLIETRLGLLTSSASPSVSSVYGVRQDLDRC